MLGQTLTELRKQQKLTQAEMAKILGVARTTYSSYEQGRRKPDDEIQKKIADYFGVSLDFLHGRINSSNNRKHTKAETVAAHIDDDVSDDEMKEILNFIDYIKQRDHS
ncbi:helix-turn-helix transcriptional regulator [Enterococcus avium]|uniref:Helix-turn-helix transcriptional regulator n=1 Tax=Enterococcus avium TaxID=33945 RepID=A0ABD5FF32_ENTAV|nr:helix-turn-helix transcriptional regulator [Enterococcus avium]MDT2485182.1 helix-turn-helix transcriptional regulator [Enterococcus avium]MDT2511743.1 helix-turn-helix transcriptional regulator [Enterococcus avium]MDT2516823.1 helix-turn-helix transcriptional regulator [Enterococcus avium]